MKLFWRMLIMLVLAGLVFGGVFGFDAFKAKMIAKFVKNFANPPQSVATMAAAEAPWRRVVSAVATLRAERGADLATDLDGIVSEIDFKSGDDVAAGTVLLKLRAEDDDAKLAQLVAAYALAKSNYERDMRQVRSGAVSAAAVDSDRAAMQQADAAVLAERALIDKKTVRAPFAGHLGIRQVDLGQYLASGTAIVTLQALDPIYADFYVPQEDVAAMQTGLAVRLTVDAYSGQVFTGRIDSANARVDAATRTLQVRAVFANADHRLLPGMFGTASVDVGKSVDYVTLPQTAITYNPYGSTVYVVKAGKVDGKDAQVAVQKFITTGLTRGDQVAVLSGVAAGETVVVAGGNKLHNGSPVVVNNTAMPLDDAHPAPAEE